MRKPIILSVVAVLALAGAYTLKNIMFIPQKGRQIVSPSENAPLRATSVIKNTAMQIISSAFNNRESIPSKYTCDGKNISPPFEISGIPDGAASLVLIAEDPDVPRNLKADGMWTHWLAWNIPASISEIAEGAEPPGVIGHNSGGKAGYQGPCPPDREHRYYFKLYALDDTLDLPAASTTAADLRSAIQGHVLAETELMGRYARQ
jgi:Raf kinase inhibitor-like YbhB/YbcL family protein